MVVPGVVAVGVSDVRLGQLGEVGLVDSLGRAGVARGHSVRLPFLPWLPGPGAPEPCGWCTRCPVMWLVMARMSVTDVVGDVHVQAELAVDVTRTDGVAVVSTRTVVLVEIVGSVLPSGVPLGSS